MIAGVSVWVVELGVAALVFAFVLGLHVFMLKPQFSAGELGLARIGAAIYALALACVVGFLLVPLRVAMLDQSAVSSMPAWLPGVAVASFIFLRVGGLRRVPGLSLVMRAHRKAMLRRTIAKSQERLDKLEAMAIKRR